MEREGVVGAHVAVLLDEEQFVIRFVGRQEADAVAVQGKAVQRAHAQHGMKVGIVVLLDPMRELAIEGVEARKVQLPAKELLTDPAKKSLHFSLRRSISYPGVGQEAADPSADLDDFLGGIDRSVIDVQTCRNTALIESRAQRLD